MMCLLNIIRRNLHRTLFGLWAALFISLVFYIYYVYNIFSGTHGPFVFGDEAAYAEMVRGIGAGDWRLHGHAQYGPLFPSLVALTSRISSANYHESAIIINSFCWLISCYFAFRICRQFELLINEALLFCALMLVAPFWSFGIVVWADPVFYCLLFAQVSVLISEIILPALSRRIIIGALAGWLFLAKPIGLFYLAPLTLAYAFSVFRANGYRFSNARILFVHILQILISAITIMFPWFVRNWVEAGSVLGYSYATQLLNEMILRDGLMIAVPLFKGFSYQISYVILSSMGFLGVLIYIFIRYFKILSNELCGVTIYVLLIIGVIALISDLHNTPNPVVGYFVPNGRYLTQLVPVITILCFTSIRFLSHVRTFGLSKISVQHVGIMFFVQAMIVLLATPLIVLAPAALVNHPDLGLFFAPEIFPFNIGLPWRGWPHTPSNLLVVGSILLLLPSIFAMIAVVRNWSIRLLVIPQIVLVASGSVIQFGGINIMQETQKSLNVLFRSASYICTEDSYFDKELPAASEEFMHRFWCNDHGIQKLGWKEFKETDITKSQITNRIFITRVDRIPKDGTSIKIHYKNEDYVVIGIDNN